MKILLKQTEEIQKELNIRQDEFIIFINRLLALRKVPLDRISEKGDSLKWTPNELLLILKPKKK